MSDEQLRTMLRDHVSRSEPPFTLRPEDCIREARGRDRGREAARMVAAAVAAAVAIGSGLVLVRLFDPQQGQAPSSQQPASSSMAGCRVFRGPITESTAFTSYADQRDHLPVAHVPTMSAADVQARLSRLPQGTLVTVIAGSLIRSVSGGNGSYAGYYSQAGIDVGTTLPQFFAGGGIELDVTTSSPDFSVDDIVAHVGSRAVKVQIGSETGVLVWADPITYDGLRTHNVYWGSNGTFYALLSSVDAATAVTFARSVECSTSNP